MKKFKIIIGITSIFILSCVIAYLYIVQMQIDTRYSIRFSEILESKDIRVADGYFDQDTVIACGDKKGGIETYGKCD